MSFALDFINIFVFESIIDELERELSTCGNA